MTVQAQAFRLQARQFRAFDREGLAGEFAVPAHWGATTMAAFGRPRQEMPARCVAAGPSSVAGRGRGGGLLGTLVA